jgi:glycosyltransferase involved in cell wall biosynthesis
VSIVIPAYQAVGTIGDCLAALVPQCRRSAAEIIVVDSGTDGTAQLVAERFPQVVLVCCPVRQDPGAARNIGVSRARGTVIGFVDADCIAAPDWVDRVLAAHDDDVAAVGGAIAPAAPRHALDWAAYFTSFAWWMPGTPPGPMADIPTCCLSIKRRAFERYGPFRERGYSSDTELNWRITRGGGVVRFDPRIQVEHVARPTWHAFSRRLFERGRAFAQMRVGAERVSPWRRVCLAALCPGLPVVLLARVVGHAVRHRVPYRRALLTSAPLVLVGFGCWSAGELRGYVRG